MPGVELVMQETSFYPRLEAADLVVTGEGRIDSQTAFGKTAQGVAQRARAAGVPCLAVGGSVTAEGAAVLAAEGGAAIPAVDSPMTLEEAMADAAALVSRAGERLARLVGVAAGIAGERQGE
jgi:glycerate kinase